MFRYEDIDNIFTPVTFKIISYWYTNYAIEMLRFSQNSGAGFHVTAVPIWLKLKYYLRCICFVIYNFQMKLPSGQWSVAIS